MADEPRKPLTPEQLAAWRQSVLDAQGPSGSVVADVAVAEAGAIARTGRPAGLTVARIAEAARVSAQTVRNKLNALEKQGLIRKTQVGGAPGEGRQQGNVIEPTLPEEIGKSETEMEDYGCISPARAGPQRKSRSLVRLRLTAV